MAIRTDSDVTVVGAEAMGSAMVRALFSAGQRVTVWNRTKSRTKELRQAGALVAETLTKAIASADLIIMCVTNQSVCSSLLSDTSVIDALHGRTLVQFTTGTPSDGRRNAKWADRHDVHYIDGAILAYPRDIGTNQAIILYCDTFDSSPDLEMVLRSLGSTRFTGIDAGSTELIDAALISFYFSTLTGFLHGAALAEAAGVDSSDFRKLSEDCYANFITSSVKETMQRVAERNYAEPESGMSTNLGGIELLVLRACQEAGVNVDLPSAIRDIFVRAIAAGHEHDDIACLHQVMREEGKRSDTRP
jgi:3-hydroxyisobutyrate dehydrogenase-like beta-hydroxyacid dehydrogenase